MDSAGTLIEEISTDEVIPLGTSPGEPAEIFPAESAVRWMIPHPRCHNMHEHPSAGALRSCLNRALASGGNTTDDPLMVHLAHGLAYTVGSALGNDPPSSDACLAAFRVIPHRKAGLTAGARAWSKHAHRSGNAEEAGWWGTPRGSVATLNEGALALFQRIVREATWRNLHWLPHQVLVYEIRVPEGYGMRWSRDLGGIVDDDGKLREGMEDVGDTRPWVFRGFVEPMMPNGHEVGWKHQ